MRRIIDSDIIALMARIILAGIFILATYYKIVDPAAFGNSIWNYHILPTQTINIIALVLPWLEILTGIALLVGAYYRGAILWINIMLVVFITALASTIYRGLDIDCGCFKAAASAVGPAWDQLNLDIGLLVLALFLLVSRARKWQLANLI